MRAIDVAVADRHPLRPDQRRVGWTAGWEVRTMDADTMYVYSGSYVGAAAHMSYVPARGCGVAVVVNGNAPPVAEVVAAEAYDWLAGRPSPDVAPRRRQITEREASRGAEADSARSGPSRPAAEYTGRYAEEHWGDATVAAAGGDVAMRLGEYTMRLDWSPGGDDRFTADGDTPGRFERDARGRVRAVWLKLSDQDSTRFARR